MRVPTPVKLVWTLSVFPLVLACGSSTTRERAVAEPEPISDDGFFSLAQSQRGRDTFRTVCSECHVPGDFRGPDFEWEWRRRTAWDLYETIVETMPEDAPGSLSSTTYASVIAYILELNEYVAGARELEPNEASLGSVPLGPNVNKTGRTVRQDR